MTLRALDDLVDEMLRVGRPTPRQIEQLDAWNWSHQGQLLILKRHPSPLSLAQRLLRLGDFAFEHGMGGGEEAYELGEWIILALWEFQPELTERAYELGEKLRIIERDVGEPGLFARPAPALFPDWHARGVVRRAA